MSRIRPARATGASIRNDVAAEVIATYPVRPNRRAIVPRSHDSPDPHFEWQRCGATPARPSMPPGPADEQSPAWNDPAHEEARSPPAPPARDIAPKAASPRVQTSLVACRLPSGTILFRQPAIPRPEPQPPRLPGLPRLPPRTVAADHVSPPAVDQVTAT